MRNNDAAHPRDPAMTIRRPTVNSKALDAFTTTKFQIDGLCQKKLA